MWGSFEEVTPQAHRSYVRAYWRFLLGWGRVPLPTTVPDPTTRKRLRARAREEIHAYRKAASKGAKIFYPYPTEPPDEAA